MTDQSRTRGKLMRKRNLILGAGTVLGGAFIFTNLLRGPGDAATAEPRVIDITVVDRCGNLVRESDGRPMILRFQVDPPPLEGAVANDPSVELLPPTEGTQVGVFMPADPRKTTNTSVDCVYVTGGGGA